MFMSQAPFECSEGEKCQTISPGVGKCQIDGNILGEGGGVTLIFSSYVGSGPVSTLHPKNIRNFIHPKNI